MKLFFLPLALSSADALSPEAVAERVVAALGRREHGAVVADFDATMKQALSSAKLAGVWEGLEAQHGAFLGTGRTIRQSESGYTIVLTTCRFKRGELDAKVVIDRDRRVAGLFFVPVVAEWSAPAYADAQKFTEHAVAVGAEPGLAGVLTVPKSRGPGPAVVLVHGSGPHDSDSTVGAIKPFRDLAWGLASRGVAVLRYEKRTYRHAASIIKTRPELTVEDEVIKDVVAAVRLLERRTEIDPKRIFIAGHSLGAELVPRIANQLPSLAGGIMLAASVRPIGDLIVEQVTYLAKLDGHVDAAEELQIEAAEAFRSAVRDPLLRSNAQVDLFGTKTPGSYWLDERAYDPIVMARQLALPLLLLQGDRDYQVTTEDLAVWRHGLRDRPRTTTKTFAGLNHFFVAGEGACTPAEYSRPGHVAADVIEAVGRWIQQP